MKECKRRQGEGGEGRGRRKEKRKEHIINIVTGNHDIQLVRSAGRDSYIQSIRHWDRYEGFLFSLLFLYISITLFCFGESKLKTNFLNTTCRLGCYKSSPMIPLSFLKLSEVFTLLLSQFKVLPPSTPLPPRFSSSFSYFLLPTLHPPSPPHSISL